MKKYFVMWCGPNGRWHTQRFANLEQAHRCAAKHGVAVGVEPDNAANKPTRRRLKESQIGARP